MTPSEHPSGRPARMLARCPRCESQLMTPVDATSGDGDEVVIERQCPECGHHDRVVRRRSRRSSGPGTRPASPSSMHALADALEDGAPIELSEISVI